MENNALKTDPRFVVICSVDLYHILPLQFPCANLPDEQRNISQNLH